LGTTSAINIASGPVTGPGATSSASASSSSSATASATTKATAAAKPVATKKAGATKTPASGNSAASNSATPTAAATTAPATSAAINGTFTGPSVNVNYGNVDLIMILLSHAQSDTSTSGTDDHQEVFEELADKYRFQVRTLMRHVGAIDNPLLSAILWKGVDHCTVFMQCAVQNDQFL
jgi:membrane protein involved in colicin uptake